MAMTPPKKRVQNVFPWGGGVFQNEMKLLQMIEGDRLGDFSKLLPVLFLLFIFPPTLPSGSRNLSAVVLWWAMPILPTLGLCCLIYYWGKSIKSYLKCSLKNTVNSRILMSFYVCPWVMLLHLFLCKTLSYSCRFAEFVSLCSSLHILSIWENFSEVLKVSWEMINLKNSLLDGAQRYDPEKPSECKPKEYNLTLLFSTGTQDTLAIWWYQWFALAVVCALSSVYGVC